MLAWLLGAALGPAAVALPVDWTADVLARLAGRWFKRIRRTDDLSRLVKAATGVSVDLNTAEFSAVRRLLEAEQTWVLLGKGTVEDLATQIASCLPPRDDRTTADSHEAALVIARGLLEFAVADLDPKLFQQVLLRRLERMQVDQASVLDHALLNLHADLMVRFADLIGQFKRALDRLPPGPADRSEIAVYLETLVEWLDRDPWPQDFGGSVLSPAAIERRLRVTTTSVDREKNLDADRLAHESVRLVVLGGPGSGKTWLAKRSVRRCAENALQAMAAGATLDEVELPLYTTCSHLFGAVGNIRVAVVSSALDQLADMGGSRIYTALSAFFTERNAPTLLVIDSLDEATGRSDRLRQADTLPWRIIITSRQSSWKNQLTIKDDNMAHRVGELQPLRYPSDVEPFIARWFAQRPGRGRELSAQIAQRPALQQAATVPLILAFYCIVGGSEPLPEFQRDLIPKVLKRMLTGRWRDDHDRQPDTDACIETLGAWAWSGAIDHPVSGVGAWANDIPTEPARMERTDRQALDHVAVPLGPPAIDNGRTLRRFVHRSIREHLVADHLASLTTAQAVDILLPHLWYDPDWEYAAPAALIMHPEHDRILRELICRAARSATLPGDINTIDADGEFRRFLARVASESSEADWSSEIAAVISRARMDVVAMGESASIGPAAHWESSNRRARAELLHRLLQTTGGDAAQAHAKTLLQLVPSAEDKRRARKKLVTLLDRQRSSSVAARVAETLIQLDPTAEERRRASKNCLPYSLRKPPTRRRRP